MDVNHTNARLNKTIKNALMAPTNTHPPVEFRLVCPVNVALTDISLKNPVPVHKIQFVSRVVLLGTTYDMAVVTVAKDALGGMFKLAAVPNGQILFVNYKDAYLAPINTHHTVEL